ncbi:MAG: Dabb family protein [Acidobacteriota bacterium]
MIRKTLLAVAAALAISAGVLLAAPKKPSSVIHVVTVKWKADAPADQIAAAIKAAEAINYPGLTRIWTNAIKKQLPEGYTSIIVMEFESQDALKKYAGSEAQQSWYKVYMPIREESRTHDVTN